MNTSRSTSVRRPRPYTSAADRLASARAAYYAALDAESPPSGDMEATRSHLDMLSALRSELYHAEAAMP